MESQENRIQTGEVAIVTAVVYQITVMNVRIVDVPKDETADRAGITTKLAHTIETLTI